MSRAGLKKKVALLVASSAVCLLVLEIGVRVADGVPPIEIRNYVVRELQLIRAANPLMVFDETLGWRMPDDHAAGALTTGRLGVRMNGSAIEPLPHGGILAVGDSFTAGVGVADHQTWPAVLSRRLGRPVVNAASGGWGVDQMVLRAESLIPEVEPHALIVGIFAGDSRRNCFKLYNGAFKPYFVIDGDEIRLTGVPVPGVSSTRLELGPLQRFGGFSYTLHRLMLRGGRASRWIDGQARYGRVHEDSTGVEISCRLMDRLTALRDAHDLRVMVVMLYDAYESAADEPPSYGPPVIECARHRGLEVLSTYESLHRMAFANPESFERLWLREQGRLGHLSARGNAIVASLVEAAWLRGAGGVAAPTVDRRRSRP